MGMVALFKTLRSTCRNLLHADRCSLFLRVSQGTTSFLWTVLDGGEEVKLPMTSGLVGHCASNGAIVNVPNAYEARREGIPVQSER